MKAAELVMLARTMSQRFGVDVRMSEKGYKASCEVRKSAKHPGQREFTITLPLVKDKGKFDKMVKGYLDHEIAHVQFTDFDLLDKLRKSKSDLFSNKLFTDVQNIFEDVYVEERMSKLYPGSQTNLRWLARHVFTPASAQAACREITNDWMSGKDFYKPMLSRFVTFYTLYKRRAMADKELAHSNALLDSMKNFLCRMEPSSQNVFAKIDAALAKPAQSTRDTCELAREVCEAVHDVNAQELRGDDEKVLEILAWMQQAIDEASEGAGASGDSYANLFHDVGNALTGMITQGADGMELEDDWVDSSAWIFMNECENLRESEAVKSAPVTDASSEVLSRIATLQAGFMRTIPALLQSIQFTPGRVGYVGQMAGRELYKAGVGNGRIFQRKAQRREQKVDVALLLDTSGSMVRDITDAHVCLYAALGMLKILPGVRSYAATFAGGNYRVISRFSDRRIVEHKIIGAYSSTPTAGAIITALPELSLSQDVRRILLVITDGEPDNGDALKSAIKLAHAHGIEVYGLALRCNIKMMTSYFGEDNVAYAQNVTEMPAKLADVLKKALVRAVG